MSARESGMLKIRKSELVGTMAREKRGLKADFDGLVSTLRAYVKQETLGPIRGLGRYLGFGFAGTVCFAIAEVFLLLGVVRVLQTTTTTFRNNLSFIPYLAGVVASAAFVCLAVLALKHDGKRHAND